MDWQESLKNFLNDNPDIPQGEDVKADVAAESSVKKPRLDIILDRKGRAGKTATIVAGFPDSIGDDEINSIAAQLRRRLGTGGSARGGEILIQGDRRRDVASILESLGYPSRLI